MAKKTSNKSKTQKPKVADLPDEEKSKLMQEMKDLGIGGIYPTFTVEDAKRKIEAKKSELQAGASQPEPQPQKSAAVKGEKPKKCYVCQSPVINGMCTGKGCYRNNGR